MGYRRQEPPPGFGRMWVPKGISAETQQVVNDLEQQVQSVRATFGDVPLVAACRNAIRRLLQLETGKT